jgi:hypothetical protein
MSPSTATLEKSSTNNWSPSLNKSLILSLLAATLPLCAEEPVLHTVNFPARDAAWTVEVKKTGAESDAPATDGPEIRQIEAVLKKGLRRDIVRWADGGTTQYWWPKAPAVVLFQPKPSSPVLSILPSQLGPRRLDASNFTWVNASTYQKETKVGDRPARQYVIEVPFYDGKKRYTAEIDAETGLPLTWNDGTITARFSFSEPPDEPLEMPENFRAALKRIAEIEAPAKPLGKR